MAFPLFSFSLTQFQLPSPISSKRCYTTFFNNLLISPPFWLKSTLHSFTPFSHINIQPPFLSHLSSLSSSNPNPPTQLHKLNKLDLNDTSMRTHHRSPMLLLIAFSLHLQVSLAGLLSEPAQPLKPGDYNTVPAFPVQTEAQICRLDLSAELFGGVSAACGRNLDRSRCCPVLAAWLFAAHARSALQVSSAPPPASSDLPMMPDDSQKCVNSLQSSLTSRNIHIPQPNASCDAILCFCGIRLHQITSLTCSAAFNVTGNYRNVTPTAAVRNLEHNCRNSSYAGCTKCLGALQKLTRGGKNGTKAEAGLDGSDRASRMLSRDCQLMGLTWLLARNKTAYIPTVSAVLRAIMYSAHPPHESTCSPDQENMPLAVDSLQFDKYDSSAAVPLLPLIILSVGPWISWVFLSLSTC